MPRPTRITTLICKSCEKEFQIMTWRLKNGDRGKFCSRECSWDYYRGVKGLEWRKKPKGKNNPTWKGGKPDCIDCGKQLSAYTYKRCSACNRKFRSGDRHPFYRKVRLNMRGKNHPLWAGGKGNDRKRKMGQIEYIIWRSMVFERDNYTCQDCGAKGVYLQAHHIKSWAEYPTFRYELSNGITVCRECHAGRDKHYAKFYKGGLLN